MNNLFLIFFAHFIGDFVLQSNKMAQNKSTSIVWLTLHVQVYFFTILLFSLLIMNRSDAAIFAWFNSCSHWIIDYFTSKATSYYWQKKEVHNFFVVVGFDQFLHYVLLIYSLFLIK